MTSSPACAGLLRIPGGLGVLWLALVACSHAGPPRVAGALRCEQPVHDFGTVLEGQILEHEFVVQLTGPARVDAARSDCGCTVARLEVDSGSGRTPYELTRPLPAGATLFVEARFDSHGRPGLAQRSVTLVGDGPPLPLQFLAVVEELLRRAPHDIEPVRLLEGQEVERRLRVTAADGQRFRLEATRRALPASLAVSLEPFEADAGGRATAWDVLLHLGGEAPRGGHTYPIELVSDLAVPGVEGRFHAIAPPWDVQVLGPVSLSTPSLEFGVLRPDEVASRTVRLEVHDPGFRLVEPRARVEPIPWKDDGAKGFPLGRTARVHARPDPGGRWCDFEVTLDGLDPGVTGTFLAQLVVETGHPALGQLTAIVRGTRVPGSAGGAGSMEERMAGPGLEPVERP